MATPLFSTIKMTGALSSEAMFRASLWVPWLMAPSPKRQNVTPPVFL
jgi:hypothetical protein